MKKEEIRRHPKMPSAALCEMHGAGVNGSLRFTEDASGARQGARARARAIARAIARRPALFAVTSWPVGRAHARPDPAPRRPSAGTAIAGTIRGLPPGQHGLRVHMVPPLPAPGRPLRGVRGARVLTRRRPVRARSWGTSGTCPPTAAGRCLTPSAENGPTTIGAPATSAPSRSAATGSQVARDVEMRVRVPVGGACARARRTRASPDEGPRKQK